MKKFDLNLDYGKIRKRIDIDIGDTRPKDWAKRTGVSINVVSNIHGKSGKHYPSLQYIIAVSRVTGKPVEWYLYGEKPENHTVHNVADSRTQYVAYPDSLDTLPEDIKNACRQVRDILLSDHPVIKPALLSNLAAFKHSVEKEKSQDEKIRGLNKRLKFLENRHNAERGTGTEEAASSSTGKPKT